VAPDDKVVLVLPTCREFFFAFLLRDTVDMVCYLNSTITMI